MTTPVRLYMTLSPHSIERQATLAQAEALMRAHFIRHLPVLDAGGALVGVLSWREVQQVVRMPDVDPSRVPADYLSAQDVFTVSPDAAVEDVCSTMAERRYGCAVVVHDGHVVGIFTTTDACAALAALLRDVRA